jgi:hypothetical protein
MFKPMAILATTAIALASHAALADTILVDPANPGGWAFSDADNTPSGTDSGQFVTGPGSPPLGIGSANLVVGASNSSEILINGGIDPGQLTPSFAASYQTYVTTSSSSNSGAAATLQFDLTNGSTYFGRLVFDPGLLGTVVDGQWQGWESHTDSAWYFSHSATQFSGECSINSPCSLSSIEMDLNSLSVVTEDVLFKAGSGLSDFNGNVDDLTLTIAGSTTTYNFDPNPVPEPNSLALLGAGLSGLAGVRWRRRRKV